MTSVNPRGEPVESRSLLERRENLAKAENSKGFLAKIWEAIRQFFCCFCTPPRVPEDRSAMTFLLGGEAARREQSQIKENRQVTVVSTTTSVGLQINEQSGMARVEEEESQQMRREIEDGNVRTQAT